MTVKCPKCKWTGTNAQYMKHYAKHHYKKKGATKPGGKAKPKVAKIPVWARRRK